MKAKENAPLTTSSKVAVLFEVTPKKEYKETYLQHGAMLKSELTNMPGFISVERRGKTTQPLFLGKRRSSLQLA